MKRKSVAVIICVIMVLSMGISLVACNRVNAKLLGEPKKAVSLSYEESLNGGLASFKGKANNFAAKFSASAYQGFQKNDENFVVSPISVFLALSLASECASGDTREELLSALGVSYEELKTYFPLLYRSLFVEQKRGGKIINQVNLTNSIWVDKSASVKKECISELADRFYTYSYSADFKNENSKANGAIRQFVKNKTNNLIDKNFNLSEQTLFAIINTLYLKTIWDEDGRDLPFSSQEYAFTAHDGSVVQKKLLVGDYNFGRAYETEEYRSFYTSSYGGFKIKFMLPKQGYDIDDVFTEANISTMNAVKDFDAHDRDNDIYYATRCIFPEYKCDFDGDVKDVLKDAFGVNKLFVDPVKNSDGCALSSLMDMPCFVGSINHVVNLDVNKKGIEGAAVTAIDTLGAAQPPDVVLDFVIDRAFGFVITNSHDDTLFSGVVKTI